MGKNSGQIECQTAADLERLYIADEETVLAVLRDSPHVASATAAELNPLVTKAVKNGHARVLVKLVELGASPNGEGNVEKGEVRGPGRDGPESIAVKVMDKMHPLMTAMFRQDEACVRTLLELGCDPEGGMTPSVPETVLFMMAQVGTNSNRNREADVRICQLLLDHGADVNYQAPDGSSTVGALAQHGLDEMIEVMVDRGADIDLLSDSGHSPLLFALGGAAGLDTDGSTEKTIRLLVRLGAKLQHPHIVAKEVLTGTRLLPESIFRHHGPKSLANLIRYVIDNGGDEADPNSRATPEALAERVALVDEFERAEAAFAPGDRVVVDGLRAKTKYNGKTGVVRGPLGANGRFPVAVNMTQGVETIALKVANLRAADE